MFVIMKEGKYTRDFEAGKLTTSFKKAEKFTSKKAATVLAGIYGKAYGKGYKVVEI